MLLACRQYRYLSALDFLHLGGFKSLPHVRRLLRELCGGADGAERPYLFRVPLPHARPGGTEKLYFLTSRARHYLAREEGLEVEWYWRYGRARQVSPGHLIHDLTANRFLIALRSWCNRQEDIHLAEIRTQDELARAIPTQEGTPKVVPDAWVNVEIVTNSSHPERVPLILEIDGGTQWQLAFKERLAARLAFIRSDGLYKQIFATEFVTIVYLTIAGARRADAMARWAREAVAAEQGEDWAEVLLFGHVEFEKLYEQANMLFSEPVWQRPDGGAVRLFE
jgi:hypothetical protein